MNITFEGKTILITGATGSLGKQLVHDYYESGASVLVLLDVNEKLEDLKELESEYGNERKVFIFCADFTHIDEVQKVVTEMEENNISVDVLVNNAGINILSKTNDMDESMWDQVLDINLKGSFFLTKLVGHSSLIANKGNVLFISSQHGVVGNVMRSAYCASKSALLGVMRALTAEWSAFDVRVNSISPTFILNEKNQEYLLGAREKRNYLNRIPLHKYAVPSDISSAILFITSDKAAMITGHNLIVDGGYTSI